MSGAELHHHANVILKEGKQELVFAGLSPNLNANTILIDISQKDITILSVSSRTNYVDGQLDNAKIALVKDSLNALNDQLILVQSKISVYTSERNMLFKNESIGGTSNNVPVAEIQKAADFYRTRLMQIDEKVFDLNKEERMLSRRYNDYANQLNELNARFNPPTSDVSIVVMSNKAQSVNISLKYQVAMAGWEPKYDVRATSISKPVELDYRANVYNNCGLDWMNVKIILSTADPKQGAEKPKLESWDLAEARYYLDEDGQNLQGYFSLSKANSDYKSELEERKREDGKAPIEEMVEVAELNAEFDIVQHYTILSDAKPYIVEVGTHTLPAQYAHYSVPKMDAAAFLTAKVLGWNKLNLVSGNASVYYNGAYLGSSYINTATVNDTLVLSLGRDRMIMVERNKISEENKKIFSGNTVKETLSYEIVVKNNRDGAIVMTLQDQLPISSDKEIEITSIEVSGAEWNEDSGELTWRFNLAPGEVKKIKLSYSIKSPRSRGINADRTVRRAKAKF
jgi:uncharacterized protein (TIGR02231 family)